MSTGRIKGPVTVKAGNCGEASDNFVQLLFSVLRCGYCILSQEFSLAKPSEDHGSQEEYRAGCKLRRHTFRDGHNTSSTLEVDCRLRVLRLRRRQLPFLTTVTPSQIGITYFKQCAIMNTSKIYRGRKLTPRSQS
jgi:hypothetical protein